MGYDFYGNISDSSKPWTFQYDKINFQYFKFVRIMNKTTKNGLQNSEISFIMDKKTVFD